MTIKFVCFFIIFLNMFKDASIQELEQENESLKQKLSDAENNYIKDNHINELKSSNEKVC